MSIVFVLIEMLPEKGRSLEVERSLEDDEFWFARPCFVECPDRLEDATCLHHAAISQPLY